MKVVILENRYKTYFWDAIAKYLIDFGHEVCWIVQNPCFMPVHGRAIVIPFPRRNELTVVPDCADLPRVKNADRNINYFGGRASHYSYYKKAIWGILEHEQAELVLGEATLFHELIAVEWCRANGVNYFHPSMPGYPSGRYSIYMLDSKTAISGSSDIPKDEDCLLLAEAIRKRESIPDYMRPASNTSAKSAYSSHGSIANRLKLIRSFISGERFNTPSPIKKIFLDRSVRRNLIEWGKISATNYIISPNERYVMYPMQMQPESNIDLWGQTYRDQTKLIDGLASVLPEGWKLLVKLNPKAKYELSSGLLELVRFNEKVIPVPFSIPMATVFETASLIATVTGTVAIESVLSRKPVVQFGPGILSSETGFVQATGLGDISNTIEQIVSGSFLVASDLERIELVKKLYRFSYCGSISDPASSPAVLEESNLKCVAENLIKVAKLCQLAN